MSSEERSRAHAKHARAQARQNLEERKGTGWWLNERKVFFDHSYRLAEESRELVEEIHKVCAVADRKDSRLKLEVIIANLLRYRDRKSVVAALKATEATMAPLIHKLHDNGFLDIKMGYRMETEAHRSRIWPTSKLLDHFERVHTPGIIIDPPELVELRDEEGKPKKYKDTDKTRSIKAILKKANQVNRAAQILYGKKTLSTALIAIFKRKFTLYGRLHTKGCYHYQGYSEDERAQITINGDPTVELDFSGLHPHLLYAGQGFQLDNDPYLAVLDDPNLRDFLKSCLLAILNATSCRVPGCWVEPKGRKRHYRKAYQRTAAANAEGGINQRIGYDPKLKEQLGRQGVIHASQIIEAFQKAHAPIAHHFFSDNDGGLRTMNKDASIAIDVVGHFAKRGIPILAIHDSFIVQQQHKNELYLIMDKAYKKHSGGFSCPIK